jgi:uncharacterized protein
MRRSPQIRRRGFVMAFLLAIVALPVRAQTAPAPAEKTKIRAITFFVNLERAEYPGQIADAYKSLRFAQTIFESRGYTVQHLCIATQPFPEYARDLAFADAVKFFQELDALAAKDNLEISIGPAMYHARDNEAQAELLTAVLLSTKHLSGSLVVADKDGLHANAARAASRVMQKLSEGTPHSEGNLRFAALAMVAPLTPSFPAAYVDGFGHQFAIAVESASVVASTVNEAPDAETAKHRLTEALAAEAYEMDDHAGRVDGETGWAYVGIDLSPAPSKESSIGAAIESLSGHQAGSAEAVAAARTLAAAIHDVSLKQTGFGAVPLPIVEDRRLAQRWSEGHVGIDTLLDYSAAGSTGLDAVPLPGDVTGSQLELIIVNAASQAYRAKKPMIIRLLPVAGKTAGERTEFADPLLVNVTLQPLNYPRAKQ